MIEFKKLSLEDRDWINECLRQADYRGCEYSFTSNFIWANIYKLGIAKVKGFYCIITGEGENTSYAYPAGSGDEKEIIELLLKDAKERAIPFKMHAITADKKEFLENTFPDLFQFEFKRDDSDYIYTVEKLSKLSGKKLHGKRNHIARFKDCEDWQFVKMTPENLAECKKMNVEWCIKNNCEEDPGLKDEMCAVERAFNHFEELGLEGGFIRREGKVVAYTIGEPLSSDTYVVHIEKAFHEIQGAYPIINQQFVLHCCQDFEYVNREEDTGDEGLRKAKLSYYPDILLEKYVATLA